MTRPVGLLEGSTNDVDAASPHEEEEDFETNSAEGGTKTTDEEMTCSMSR